MVMMMMMKKIMIIVLGLIFGFLHSSSSSLVSIILISLWDASNRVGVGVVMVAERGVVSCPV